MGGGFTAVLHPTFPIKKIDLTAEKKSEICKILLRFERIDNISTCLYTNRVEKHKQTSTVKFPI